MTRGARSSTDASALDAELRRVFDALMAEQAPDHLIELERTLLALLRERAERKSRSET